MNGSLLVIIQIQLSTSEKDLIKKIGSFDGLAIRSSTEVTKKTLEHANNLKIIGRAGIGVDNIDLDVATQKGIIVMNTPFGNSITTAEHTIALMMALSRNIPLANTSTHEGKWEKSLFTGTELYSKVLGMIGCGNIGSIVADRARGLRMKVIGFDPYMTPEHARETGIEKVDLDELLANADFISLHTPLTDQTRNILSADALNRTKKGVRVINCARGGLIDELALAAALDTGHVAGAALDVFETEPCTDSPLFQKEGVVCTPHLGASTEEAQTQVAVEAVELAIDYLTTGAVRHAVNVAAIDPKRSNLWQVIWNWLIVWGSFWTNGMKAEFRQYKSSIGDTLPMKTQSC